MATTLECHRHQCHHPQMVFQYSQMDMCMAAPGLPRHDILRIRILGQSSQLQVYITVHNMLCQTFSRISHSSQDMHPHILDTKRCDDIFSNELMQITDLN
jgi:hypothetical protein